VIACLPACLLPQRISEPGDESISGKAGGMYGKTTEYLCESYARMSHIMGSISHESFPKPRDNVETAGKTPRSRGRTFKSAPGRWSLGFDKWTGS
jgi:hypothetical protein